MCLRKGTVSYLLQMLFVLVSMVLPHVSLLSFGVAEGDKALKALQTLLRICRERDNLNKYATQVFIVYQLEPYSQHHSCLAYSTARGRPLAQT